MTTTLSARQGMLTKTTGRLSAILDDVHGKIEASESEFGEDTHSRKMQLIKLKKSVEVACTSVENALNAYTSAADTLDRENPQGDAIIDKISSNASIAQDLILRAQNSRIELEMALEELSMDTKACVDLQAAPMQLAPIPIPKFSGKVWEWESFWSAFDYSVHSRKMGDIYKMNYLMESLEGEAKKSVKRFQISGSTYTMAIAHLKRKFGNPQLLLEELARQLEGCRASTSRVDDQMSLYEEISSILNQMALKGECLDTVVLQKQILPKFSERVQRHVLRKKHEQTASEPWTTEMLLSHISDFLDTEVEIKHYLQEQSQEQPCKPSQNSIVKKTTDIPIGKERIHTCFYCKRNDHSPKDCPEFGTQVQRLEHMKRFSLCMNCGGTNHIASACTKGACRLCHQKGHHTSICPQKIRSTVRRPMHSQRKPATAADYPKPTAQRKTRQHFVSSTPNEGDDDEDNVEAITCMKTTSTASKTKQCVLVGEAQVFNVNTRALETIHILLDTGADRSFISEDLARRLQLENTHTVRLSVNTLGNQKSREIDCGVTDLQLFDHEGKSHWFQVTRIHHITESLQRNELTYEDKHYIAENNIKLSVSQDFQEVRPEVLLGCSDAFSLIDREDQSSKVLPSGLRLIPSRLGYLITGPLDNYVSNTAMKTTRSFAIQESNQKWDEFLALQNSGIQEFTLTKTQELEMENDKVWRNFKATIEHHKDGYYVQLPWKEEAVFLPDNKLIAYRRLCLNLLKLQTTPDVLRQYHQTDEEQLNKGNIEKVDVRQPPTGKIVYYLSHQAVITPAKEFTRLRVVFDASAHFNGHPSLNDVLHQGPVILPLMRDMLLRFRIGNIAMIADVEKASLQIRLKTDDRDATRCLLVKDPTKPPNETNLVEYRITRVTFGLNCSPFLLAGTIKYHLQENTPHKELAKEVYRNVYVDNVILTASNEEEAIEKYRKSKAIFAEMNINLRGYLTNNERSTKISLHRTKVCTALRKFLEFVGIQ